MQMREAARRAQSLCHATNLEALRLDWVRRMAFERCFEILGEAIKRLPGELRNNTLSMTGGVLPGCGTSWFMAMIGWFMKCCGMRFGMTSQACSPRWSRYCLTWVESCR